MQGAANPSPARERNSRSVSALRALAKMLWGKPRVLTLSQPESTKSFSKLYLYEPWHIVPSFPKGCRSTLWLTSANQPCAQSCSERPGIMQIRFPHATLSKALCLGVGGTPRPQNEGLEVHAEKLPGNWSLSSALTVCFCHSWNVFCLLPFSLFSKSACRGVQKGKGRAGQPRKNNCCVETKISQCVDVAERIKQNIQWRKGSM